jgi:hypothetical protein
MKGIKPGVWVDAHESELPKEGDIFTYDGEFIDDGLPEKSNRKKILYWMIPPTIKDGKWNDAKLKKPRLNRNVFALVGEGNCVILSYGKYESKEKGVDMWIMGDFLCAPINVTHWRSIPGPPMRSSCAPSAPPAPQVANNISDE